jgi:hypothetical protein
MDSTELFTLEGRSGRLDKKEHKIERMENFMSLLELASGPFRLIFFLLAKVLD